MGRIVFISIVSLIFIALDLYVYHGMASVFAQGKWGKFYKTVYIGLIAFSYFSIIYVYWQFSFGNAGYRTELFNFLSGFIFTVLVTKLLFSAMLFLQDGGRFLVGSFRYVVSLFTEIDDAKTVFIPERRHFFTSLATITAGIPFFGMLYGITKGKYLYTVEKITLAFDDLPAVFDGFKIVQISDVHSGSFDNIDKVKSGIDKINTLDADIVCFTGDLVNSEKEEIDPYIEIFAAIEAKYGKFAILGNHDYYGTWDRNNIQAEQSYFQDFFNKYKKMGFDLLNNENRQITIEGQHINIIGVENWGAGRWFPKRGDLDKATSTITKNGFNLLMSHDPTHWDEKVLQHSQHIHLTLSGHTHGFQFGFQMPGFKWSPAQYRYKKWLGLYQEREKYLYVNRGFGFLGFPGRVGMWPEITVIELKKSKQNS